MNTNMSTSTMLSAASSPQTRQEANIILQRNALSSPLLRLPAEIRNCCWFYAHLEPNGIICVRFRDGNWSLCTYDHYGIYDGKRLFEPSSLFHASSQIRAECRFMRYSINVFEVYIWGIKGLMVLLPKDVIEDITTLRISMGFRGQPMDKDKLGLHLESTKESLALLYKFKGLREVQLVIWTGYHRATTRDQRHDMKKAILECAHKDLEVV